MRQRTIHLQISTHGLAVAVCMVISVGLLVFLPRHAKHIETWQTAETVTIPNPDDPALVVQFDIHRVFATSDPVLMPRGDNRLVTCDSFLTLIKDGVELARIPIETPAASIDRLSLGEIENKLKNHETRGEITAAVSGFTGIFRPYTPMLDDEQKARLQASYGIYPQPFPHQITSLQSLGTERVPGFWQLEVPILLVSLVAYFIIFLIFREPSKRPADTHLAPDSAKPSSP